MPPDTSRARFSFGGIYVLSVFWALESRLQPEISAQKHNRPIIELTAGNTKRASLTAEAHFPDCNIHPDRVQPEGMRLIDSVTYVQMY